MTDGGQDRTLRPIPPVPAGRAVGLLGGSFDPPHEGHLHITRAALKRFRLSQVWWLVSPGNPLKRNGPAPLARRVEAARAMLDDPRVVVTDLEAHLGTRYTADTLRTLRRLRSRARFVWLMGADNLAQLHRWDDWTGIMRTVPIGVLARPGSSLRAGLSPAARRFARHRLPPEESGRLAWTDPPAWCFLPLPLVSASSTAIRARGDWPGMTQG
ncbi:nicotinate-nucleotide adenylyltransferase [Roseitranquillus sediminis]|uniref:nicotinate-nucleotide adenylyltransferase n=1 Tax=Roseitranquillus sediminis TaxID=2809051 RepID=UPI001D0C13A5|nr:nicotinate-nucleotide adenylyltransferase [Roseitranquillus sediminis]